MSAIIVDKPREGATKNVIQGIVLGLILTALSYLVGFHFGWVAELNLLEVFAVFTSYVSTYLCVVERRFNYLFGAVSTAAYAVLFFQNALLGSALLNLYLTPTLAYGWFRWKKDVTTRPVQHVSWKMIPVYLVVTAAFWFGATTLFAAVGGSMAMTDTVILAATILAQFLLDNKKIETWIVWAVVNVFAIYTYFNIGLALVGFQYIFFLANTVWGYIAWRKSMHSVPLAPPALAADAVTVDYVNSQNDWFFEEFGDDSIRTNDRLATN